MLERDGYPAGVPCWVDTTQPDPEAAVRFYGDLFEWQFQDRMPSDSPTRYFAAQLRGRDVAGIGSQPEQAPPGATWNTYIWVDSADEIAEKVKDAGGRVLAEPFAVQEAGRMAMLADPSGAAFGLWEAKQWKGAQLVNEPGTWNFSELNTRDVEESKAFYGAVFGWKASEFEMEGQKFGMFGLPGYGDHLVERDPELRDRQAGQGAPPGFEDAVAWLIPMTSDQSSDDVPPHWSVTFAVADADAVADRAPELGGKVVVPPFEAGPTRTTVISDPQGATFSASKYQPQTGAGGD
jgi:uncharacterized protein